MRYEACRERTAQQDGVTGHVCGENAEAEERRRRRHIRRRALRPRATRASARSVPIALLDFAAACGDVLLPVFRAARARCLAGSADRDVAVVRPRAVGVVLGPVDALAARVVVVVAALGRRRSCRRRPTATSRAAGPSRLRPSRRGSKRFRCAAVRNLRRRSSRAFRCSSSSLPAPASRRRRRRRADRR